ncbi:MAG: sigma-70 family RNA polymerase sigma factor [Phocaeicola vulgatus]|nr:sigma-70 family RNA polymerase sigma factor [Phocaeicola vulgatus]
MIVEPEVVGEFASGSHEAFHKIFKLFYPKVYAFIRGFIKDLDDSEDLTQIVFIKLWNKRAIFHNRFTSEDNVPEISDEYTPYDKLIAKDLQLLIDMVVNEMPPKRKMIYKLSRIKGLSNEQIAEKLGIQKKTVENHLNIALNELRDALALSILVYLILSV